jgi:hypothetical protein
MKVMFFQRKDQSSTFPNLKRRKNRIKYRKNQKLRGRGRKSIKTEI